MSQEEPTFFPTQIAQKGNNESQLLESPESPQPSPEPTAQKVEEDPCSLRQLLTAFNSFDRQEKGLIQLQNSQQIISSRNISTQNIKQYHIMSLPLYENQVSFDQFLFILGLAQSSDSKVEEKYVLCKKVDERLIDFLKLLNKYRKKSEKNGNYKEAKNSRNKIQEIRNRQLERRNKYLKILHQNEIIDTENAQKAKFQEFCSTWDQFMNQYQLTASDLVKKVKERQITQINQYQLKVREELASKMHFSKYLLELQLKEKNLVKLQEYQKAKEVQQDIEDMKVKEIRQKELADQQIVQLRLKALRKQQDSVISTLLQKIQKDRNDHMRQRQTQTEKLMVRSKSQLTQIDHRFSETMKKIYEALHNLGLESDKNIRISKQ